MVALFSDGIIFQMVMYIVSLAATGGAILQRINQLEKKVDKHNGLIERMVAVEQSVRSAHHRLDEIARG